MTIYQLYNPRSELNMEYYFGMGTEYPPKQFGWLNFEISIVIGSKHIKLYLIIFDL